VSMATVIYQAHNPPVYAVAYNREQRVFRRAGDNDADETFPGLLILRVEGRLLFANAENAGEKMRALIEQMQPRVIALDCSAVLDIEYTALVELAAAEQRLRGRGVELWLAGVNPGVLPVLERSPLTAAKDERRLFANLHKVLEAWQSGVVPREVADKEEVRS